MTNEIKVIDLFCGIGGLSHGLLKEGLNIVAGIDNDSSCKYGYEYNNKAMFIDTDILKVTSRQINELFGKREDTIKVLAGCAPCQPFSKLNLNKVTKAQLEPLEKFAELISETRPDIVSMENVSGLAEKGKYPAFAKFIKVLEENDYDYKYELVDVAEFGVPQRRRRLVLLASRFGKIELIKRTHKDNKVTVRDVIKHLPAIQHGQVCQTDPLHRARKLQPINVERIKATPKDGGSSNSWPKHLILECHKKDTGQTYKATVYGRMKWDAPAPTMTTQCVGLGNGRYGHPTQDRAITLREAAIFQTFPQNYRFYDPTKPIIINQVARYIGNAVPVKLGSVIGKSIKKHLKDLNVQKNCVKV